MLFTIGPRSYNGDIVDLLIACHHRIREHLVLGRRLARAPVTTDAASIRAAAACVRTYFERAFPLHRDDEEEDVFPLLLGRDDELDAAIGELMRDHVAHEAHVKELADICASLEHDPTQLHARAESLGESVRYLEQELVAHLALEERTVFPAIERMALHERAGILDRMRKRREATPSPRVTYEERT